MVTMKSGGSAVAPSSETGVGSGAGSCTSWSMLFFHGDAQTRNISRLLGTNPPFCTSSACSG
eukprot:9116470-Prorocentrum_lima.AAC.1